MRKAARLILAGLICAGFTACTVPTNVPVKQGGQVIKGSANQPHLPPPDIFSPDNVTDERKLCGARGLKNICEPSEFCRYDITDQCGAADKPGTCTIRSEICTKEYRPVCGCDGNSYSNACTAEAKGISVKSVGKCP